MAYDDADEKNTHSHWLFYLFIFWGMGGEAMGASHSFVKPTRII